MDGLAPTFRLEQVVKARQEVMEDFEGPLDLILDLLRRHRIEIQDLHISTLLEQYLEWLALRESMDLEVASEFIAMASHLVYLKTHMLLTVGQDRDEEVDELILALEERLRLERLQKLIVGVQFLDSRAELARSLIVKQPEPLAVDKTYVGHHAADDLRGALMEVYERSERKLPPPPSAFSAIVGREPYPVGDKIDSILSLLLKKGRAVLRTLLRAPTRSEAVASFLAVLELCRSQLILIEDSEEGYVVSLPEEEPKS